ncbi:hypothetical protein D3C75_1235730 [compost metagenome]
MAADTVLAVLLLPLRNGEAVDFPPAVSRLDTCLLRQLFQLLYNMLQMGVNPLNEFLQVTVMALDRFLHNMNRLLDSRLHRLPEFNNLRI